MKTTDRNPNDPLKQEVAELFNTDIVKKPLWQRLGLDSKQRALQCFQLSLRGFSNAEVGRKLEMHSRTVARDIMKVKSLIAQEMAKSDFKECVTQECLGVLRYLQELAIDNIANTDKGTTARKAAIDGALSAHDRIVNLVLKDNNTLNLNLGGGVAVVPERKSPADWAKEYSPTGKIDGNAEQESDE